MVERTISSDPVWRLTLPSVTVLDGEIKVTIIYENLSSAPQGLVCSDPPQKQSITINGQTTTERSSYCAKNVGRSWTVPAGGKFPSWATFPAVPDLAVPLTLNNWYGFGSVADIQLVPYECIIGPGGSCLGLPNTVRQQWMPTPPEWVTSPVAGACILEVVAAGTGLELM